MGTGRERLTLIGLGCNQPCATCFCTSVGGGPFHGAGLDLLLTDLGEVYLAQAITAKGEALFQAARRKPIPVRGPGQAGENPIRKQAEAGMAARSPPTA